MGFITHFKNPNIANYLSQRHDKYVVVPVDNVPCNVVIVCKSHYIHCLIKELGIDNSLDNPTYTPTILTKEEILNNHGFSLCSFGISTIDKEMDLPSRYWIPKITQESLVILLGLPIISRNLIPNYYHPFYQRSKLGIRVTVPLATQVMVCIRCGFCQKI